MPIARDLTIDAPGGSPVPLVAPEGGGCARL